MFSGMFFFSSQGFLLDVYSFVSEYEKSIKNPQKNGKFGTVLSWDFSGVSFG